MNRNSVLFFTYWYPNKNNKSFGIFIKRHAESIQSYDNIVVLSLNILKGKAFYKKSVEVFVDEEGLETHKIWLESRFYALLFILLPLHYSVVKKYIHQNLIKLHHFNVLHSNIIFPCAIVGNRLAWAFSCRHFITEHWTKIDNFFLTNTYRFLGKKVYNEAKAITCVSEQLATTLKNHTTNRKIKIIPNVIDSKEFYYDSTVTKNSTLTFIAISYWANFKNPFYFLDALAELHAERKLPDFKLTLIGIGEQVEKIKNSGYLYRIDYRGGMYGKEVNAELNKSHIFLHGSDFETFSVIIAEALMCGLPSVVSPVGIAPEVINRDNGFVTNNTAVDWKEKILACYNATYNYGQIAAQLKDRYSLETVGALFSKMYGNPE